jgi:hypothetical protein
MTGGDHSCPGVESETRQIKHELLAAAGETDPRLFELDHRVPLDLGGAPLDLRNLRLQPWPEARCKDALKVELSKAVCIGSVTLAEAQREIATDWRAAYKDWLDPKGCE